MLEAEEACSSNHIPRDFLPGPDLTQDQAFDRMAACTEESLANLDIPMSDRIALTEEDMERQAREAQRRTLIDRQTEPAKAVEVDQYNLAEAITFTQTGYFYPGMPEKRQRQLAAIIAEGTPDIVHPNTPGAASTSTTLFLC